MNPIMIRWMYEVKLNERKKSEKLRGLLALEPVSYFMVKKNKTIRVIKLLQ